MEHLPCPDGTIAVEIPYLDGEEYDNGDFASYPERRGWDKQRIFARGLAGRDP